MAATLGQAPASLSYQVSREAGTGAILVRAGDGDPVRASDEGAMLRLLDKDLTVALQLARPDLYFLHAAALAFDGRAYLLAADSGGGKSTLAWALLHLGFGYLSDELAPIDDRLDVFSFPHALTLKRRPPAYPLPAATLDHGATLHIPARALPGVDARQRCPLAGIVFVSHEPSTRTPAMRPIGVAEAAARLYALALNPLAHPNQGLDVAVAVARGARCFTLQSAGLVETAELARSTLLA
jgi:hypothetical protein